MSKPRRTSILLPLFFLSLLFRLPVESQDNSQAFKVFELLEKIEQKSLTSPGAPLQTVVVSENELNAYIAYRIAAEKEEILRDLEFKLLAKNKIEGRALIDLSGREIPAGLRARMNLFFSAKIQAIDRKIKLEMESLYLEHQRISTALLDLIVFVIAKLNKAEPVGLQDWHDLPYGIKSLETEAGKLKIRY